MRTYTNLKKIKILTCRVRHEEQGAVLAITAVLLSVLFYFVIAFSIDAARIKAAAIDLRAKTDMMCRALAYEPMWQSQTTEIFQKHVNSFNLLYGAKVIEASLRFPAMDLNDPGSERNFPFLSFHCMDNNSNCSLSKIVSGDYIGHTVLYSDIGSYVHCEVKATVTEALPAPGWLRGKNISATSAWTRPVYSASEFNKYDENSLAFYEKPALTLAIATQMTTRVGDERFNFSDAMANQFNPLVPGEQGVYLTPTEEQEYSSEFKTYPPAVVSSSDLDEMLVACMNPAVFVRNTFSSVIVELASRHGQLKKNTEIVSVNPKDKSATLQFPFVAPTLIASFGEDLAERNFQHPFVFYPAGTSAFPPLEGHGAPKGRDTGTSPNKAISLISPLTEGPVNDHPFYNLSQPDHQRIVAHQALIAGQLRFCNLLYSLNDSGGPRLERLPINSLEFVGEYLPDQDGYHWNLQWPESDSFWDLANAWVSSLDSKRLTAGEVVASLGTIQSCPYEESGLPIDLFPDGKCSKPDLPEDSEIGSQDTEGDFASLLDFLMDDDVRSGAISSPGLAPLDLDENDELRDDKYPFVEPEKNYKYSQFNPGQSKNKFSHILLVLHTPFSESEEQDIREKVDALSEGIKKRPITVVYIPTNERDASEGTIARLEYAFDASTDFNESSDVDENRLYVFSPYEEIHNIDGEACDTTSVQFCNGYTNQSAMFRDYWEYLLISGNRYGIQNRARAIFLERILRERILL